MGSLLGGVVALVVGAGLAVASVIGVVQMRSDPSGSGAPTTDEVRSQVVTYGSNQ